MAGADLASRLSARFPALAALPPHALQQLLSRGIHRHLRAGERLFAPDEPCAAFPLLLEGSVRVVRENPQGKSIVLYTVHAGELCIASSESLFSQPSLMASAYAETDVELLALPPDLLDDLLAKEPAFRRFYFGLIGARLSDLALAVEAVAFLKLDQRIAALLVEKGPRVTLTHQAMADRLGVAREMVSRVMRGFADRGWVAQSREFIEVTDIAALDALAEGRVADL